MRSITSKFLSSYLIVLLALSPCICLTRAQEVENEREFSYNESSINGPSNWGAIRQEWRECNSGNMQSPIDLLNERVVVVSNSNELETNYRSARAVLVNRGHDMMVEWTGNAGHIKLNGTIFDLKQAHWHTPSEHTLDGRKFSMETHLVHMSQDNRIAVTGVLYTIGISDFFLSQIEDDLEAVVRWRNVERDIGFIDPDHITFASRNYYRYAGSLTTPPCTQNVIWTIFQKIETVSTNQVTLLRNAVNDNSEANARPVQPLNQRRVDLYRSRLNI